MEEPTRRRRKARGRRLVRELGAALRRRLPLILPLCTIVLVCAVAMGADSGIPTVNVTAAGPDGTISFGSPFYLTGTPDKGVDRVQAIVARKGTPWIFPSPDPSCYDVRAQLADLVANGGADLPPGVVNPDQLATRVNLQRTRHGGGVPVNTPINATDLVMVTESWVRPAADPAGTAADTPPAATSHAGGGITATVTNIITISSETPSSSQNAVKSPADGGDTDAKSADAKSADAKSADAKSADAGGGDTDSGAAGGEAKAAATKPAASSPGLFKVFVPGSKEFFGPGFSYCLLVYQHKPATGDSIDTLIDERVAAENACSTPPCVGAARDAFMNSVRALVAKRQKHTISERQSVAMDAAKRAFPPGSPETWPCYEPPASPARAQIAGAACKSLSCTAPANCLTTCEAKGVHAIYDACKALHEAPSLRTPIAHISHAVSSIAEQEEEAFKADETYNKRFGTTASKDAEQVRTILGDWKFDPRNGGSAITTPTGLAPTGNLDQALLALVKRRDKLQATPVAEAISAELIDRQSVVVTRKPAGKGNATEIIPSSSLLLPNSQISVRDVVEMAFGHIRLDATTTYLGGDEVREKLEPALTTKVAFTTQERALLHAVRSQLDALNRAAIRVVSAGAAGAVPAPGSDAFIEWSLGHWLRAALTPCANAWMQRWSPGAAGPLCAPGPVALAPCAGGGWNGYCNLDSPLGMIVDALGRFERDRDILVTKPATIDGAATTTPATAAVSATVPLMGSSEFSQKIWFASYMTPVAGAAVALRTRDAAAPIVAPYVGVQLHFIPNLVDDPLWTHGWSDLKRVFAIEVGVLTNNGPFGPDARFRGFGAFPPVLLSPLSLHLIPYTSVTGGAMLLDVRSSTVTQQNYQVTALPFISFNAQVNLIDMIRIAVTKGSAAMLVSPAK